MKFTNPILLLALLLLTLVSVSAFDASDVYGALNCNGTEDSPLCNLSYSCYTVVVNINSTLYDEVVNATTTIVQEVDAVEENQATLQSSIDNIFTAMFNGSMASEVWDNSVRSLTSIDWGIFSSWKVFSRLFHSNETVEYTYNESRLIVNVTYNSDTNSTWNRTDTYNYDNETFLVSFTSRTW